MKKLLLVLVVVTMASFIFTGCLPTTNHAPIFTSTPGLTATVGIEYSYTPAATDEDGDTVTFSVAGPTGMAISAGVIRWTPTAVGTEDVVVTATDGTDETTQSFTITVAAAPVTPVAPVITAIPDQEVFWDEDGWTYPVVVTLGTGTTLTYSLIGAPVSMSISSTGLITWTTILDVLALHNVTVKVLADDGLSDEETFIIEVKEPVVVPLVIDIDVPDAYIHPTKGPIVAADCYDVVVTFSDNSITEGQDVWVRWNDVDVLLPTVCVGDWILLTGNADDTEFTGEICFDEVCTECKDICIEVLVGDLCCAGIIYSETIKVDSIAPCASFTVDIEDCDPCTKGAEMSWVTTCEDICDVPFDCCGDNCSGVGDWSFILDETECADPCDTEDGEDCPINGAFECRCLLYATSDTVDHVIDVTIADNVGNTFTDTWTLTFDTDSLVSFSALNTTPFDNGDGTWSLDYDCTWHDCEECFPTVEQIS